MWKNNNLGTHGSGYSQSWCSWSILVYVLLPTVGFGQDTLSITRSSAKEFYQARATEAPFIKDSKVEKKGNTLTIGTNTGETVTFEDDLSNGSYRTYQYIGDLVGNMISLVKAQDYHTDRFIAVELRTGSRSLLIGKPHILGNNIVCLQGAEPDVVSQIELWKITRGRLQKIKRFQSPQQIYPADIVWKNANEVIIQDSNGQFWMARIDGK